MNTRTESDTFGPVEIPAHRYWGAQTQLTLTVFRPAEERFPAALIHAFGLQKCAADKFTCMSETAAPTVLFR